MVDMHNENGAHGAVAETTAQSRTGAAGRAFVDAVYADVIDIIRRARKRKRRRADSNDAILAAPVKSRSSRIVSRVLIGTIVLVAAAALAVTGLVIWSIQTIPMQASNVEREAPAILLTASDGAPLGRVGAFKLPDATRADFPEHLIDAVLSIEDRRFYSHHGVDPRAILRAVRRNMGAGTIVEGGSTITQQLVKMLYLGNERTYGRKLREAIAAIWLERQLGKDEILTRYLNEVYLGANARGMPAAARLYFDKKVSELTLSELAMLAGLIRAPSQYAPLRDLRLAQQRANAVLGSMVANGVLSEADAERARIQPAELRRAPATSAAGSWFADWAADEASKLAGSFSGNLKVRTTLVPKLQDLAESTIARMLAERGNADGISEAALVAMRPDGAVVAMVGGRDYRQSQFNRAVQARRQPGSAFKLFVYLAALRNGYRLNDVIDAGPLTVDGWSPENFGGREFGRMTLADAFANSVNTAAARLALDVGLDQVIAAARELGIDATLPKHPSLALGAAEVSLLDLTGAYASVRAGKTPVEPFGIAAVGGEEQDQLYAVAPSSNAERPLSHQAELVDLLQQAVQRGTGRQAALDGFAAGKTGTSQNHRDAWFIGFTEELVVGVWVGNDDGTPMDEVTGWHASRINLEGFCDRREAASPARRNGRRLGRKPALGPSGGGKRTAEL